MAQRNLTLYFENPSVRLPRGISKLTRGQLVPETVSISSLRNYQLDGNLQEKIQMFCDVADGRDYGGIFYRIVFRTDRAINLQSLGFWGPHKEAIGNYRVVIRITHLPTLTAARLRQKLTPLTEFEVNVQAKKREIFFVPLDKPVGVGAGYWTQIEFELNGPVTAQSHDESLDTECCGDDGVHFYFSTTSHQLPVIKYEIT